MTRPRKLDFRAWRGAGAPVADATGREGTGSGDADVAAVVAHLRSGGLIAYPTETVYGFGGTLEEPPLAHLARLKGRGAEKPFILLVPSARSVEGLRWTTEARELAGVFWPGALTLVLSDPDEIFPTPVRSAQGAVAVRQSSHPIARRIVELLDEPITSTSANPSGAAPASSGDEAYDAAVLAGAGEELWVLDAGGLPESAPSTIVDCTGRTPRIVRAGHTPVRRIRCVLPSIESWEAEPNGSER